MSNGILGGSKFKQMGVGGGGGNPRTQYIFAAALGIIVVGTIAMVLYQSFGKGGGKGPRGDLTFQCAEVECGELFIEKVQDIKRDTMDINAPMTVDCPKCGAENAGIFTIPCPKCGKPFARNSDKYMYEFWKESGHWPMRPGPNEKAQLEDDICPHCGANVSEMRRETEYGEEE